jgi:hypothetical protein
MPRASGKTTLMSPRSYERNKKCVVAKLNKSRKRRPLPAVRVRPIERERRKPQHKTGEADHHHREDTIARRLHQQIPDGMCHGGKEHESVENRCAHEPEVSKLRMVANAVAQSGFALGSALAGVVANVTGFSAGIADGSMMQVGVLGAVPAAFLLPAVLACLASLRLRRFQVVSVAQHATERPMGDVNSQAWREIQSPGGCDKLQHRPAKIVLGSIKMTNCGSVVVAP